MFNLVLFYGSGKISEGSETVINTTLFSSNSNDETDSSSSVKKTYLYPITDHKTSVKRSYEKFTLPLAEKKLNDLLFSMEVFFESFMCYESITDRVATSSVVSDEFGCTNAFDLKSNVIVDCKMFWLIRLHLESDGDVAENYTMKVILKEKTYFVVFENVFAGIKDFKKVPAGVSEFIYLGDVDVTDNEKVRFEPIKSVLGGGNQYGSLKVINSVEHFVRHCTGLVNNGYVHSEESPSGELVATELVVLLSTKDHENILKKFLEYLHNAEEHTTKVTEVPFFNTTERKYWRVLMHAQKDVLLKSEHLFKKNEDKMIVLEHIEVPENSDDDMFIKSPFEYDMVFDGLNQAKQYDIEKSLVEAKNDITNMNLQYDKNIGGLSKYQVDIIPVRRKCYTEARFESFALLTVLLIDKFMSYSDRYIPKRSSLELIVLSWIMETNGNERGINVGTVHFLERWSPDISCYYFSQVFKVHMIFPPKSYNVLNSIIKIQGLVNLSMFARKESDAFDYLLNTPMNEWNANKRSKLIIFPYESFEEGRIDKEGEFLGGDKYYDSVKNMLQTSV